MISGVRNRALAVRTSDAYTHVRTRPGRNLISFSGRHTKTSAVILNAVRGLGYSLHSRKRANGPLGEHAVHIKKTPPYATYFTDRDSARRVCQRV
jgi:hypothetical protein